MKVQKTLIVAVVATAIVAGGAGFGGGMAYSKSKTIASRGAGQFGTGTNRPGDAAAGRLRSGTGFVNGSILSKDEKSITVKDGAGGSKIIFFGTSTTIGKTTDGTANDLEVGKSVMVSGTSNTDGSVTAKSIQIRPAGAEAFGGPNGAMAPKN